MSESTTTTDLILLLRDLDESLAAWRFGAFAHGGNPDLVEAVSQAEAEDMLIDVHDRLRDYLA